jgi:cell wall-associated NlpC family hydrolase
MMRGFFGQLVTVVTVVAAIATAGCASTGAVPRPFPVPGGSPPQAAAPTPTPADPSSAIPGTPLVDTYALTGTALALRGIPYRNGGADPAGFDCSGFTQYVFGQHGIPLPREVKDQFATGHPIKTEEIAPGDLMFFSTVAPGASHVAISLGGDEFVHAPSSTGVVRVERLSTPYWSQRFVGVRRISG